MKSRYLLFSCPILALLCICCTKSGEAALGDVSQKGTTIITANIESLLLGEGERTWPEDAYVGVFGSEKGSNEKYVLKQAGAGLSTAQFYGPLVSGNTIAAYYPWADGYTGRVEAMPMSVPTTQEYEDVTATEFFEKYCPTAFACMREGSMKFFYPAGLLRISIELSEIVNVSGITLSASGRAVAGKGVILPDGECEMAGGASSAVSLEFESPVASSRPDGSPSEFYLTTLPGTFEDADLIISLDGEDQIVCTLDGISIPRIDAYHFKLASVSVKASGPQGFTVNEQVFD